MSRFHFLAAIALRIAVGVGLIPLFAGVAAGADGGAASQARLGVSSAPTIDDVALWPDGRHMLTHQRSTVVNAEDSVRLWELSTGRAVRRFSCPPEVGTDLKGSSRDGRKIFIECDGVMQVWDLATGQRELQPGGSAPDIKVDYAGGDLLTLDGKNVLTRRSGVTMLVDRQTGREVQRFEAHAGGISSVAFSPDGRQVLTGSEANHAALWDLTSGREVMRFVGHANRVASVAFSPNGRQVLTGSADRTARLWDTTTGQEVRRYSDTGFAVMSVAFSPDGRKMLASGRTIDRTPPARRGGLWDVATGKIVNRFEGETVAFSPDGQRVLVGNDGGGVRVWDAASGTEPVQFGGESTFKNSGGVHAVAFSPDGKRVLAGRTAATVLWDATTGQQLGRYGSDKEWVLAVAFSPDGKRAISGMYSGQVRMWDLATGKEVRSFLGHDGAVTSVAFSPKGDAILTGGSDGSARLWRTDTGEELAALYSFNDGSSAVIDRQGHFDAPNGGQNAHLYWIVGLETIGLDQLKERYFEPGLLPKKLGLGNEPVRDVAALTDVALYPLVEIVQRPTRADPSLKVRLKNQGGGIGRVVVRVNGKELSSDARTRPEQDANAKELTLQIDLKAALKWLNPGPDNQIEVFAYNAAGYLRSRGQVESYESDNVATTAPVTLWAVVVGTSKYADEKFNLRYPAKDARDIARALEIGGRALFGADRVKMKLLTTDGAEAEQPTRANLRAAFDALKQAKPGDIVVAYLAGHGVASKDLYYYPTREASSLVVEDPAVWAQRAVSSDDLAQWLKESPALKQVLVLDTCAAGAAAKSMLAMRDAPADQIRALDRMKDRAGVYVLMGAAADRVSYESNEYQQGLLTYALLKGMNGARLREGQFVDIAPLLEYVADQVPLLAKGIGGIQKPYIATPGSTAPGKATASFDIGRLGPEDRKRIVLHSPRPLILAPRLQNAVSIEDDLKLGALLRERLRETSYAVARGQAAPVVYVDADEMAGAIQLTGLYTVQAPNLQVQLVLRRGEARSTLKVECRSTALDACAVAMEQQIVQAAAQLP